MLTEILSGLWIGNINDSYNEDFYKDNLITIAINCTNDQSFLDLPNLKKLRVPLSINLNPESDMFLLRKSMNKIIPKKLTKMNPKRSPKSPPSADLSLSLSINTD